MREAKLRWFKHVRRKYKDTPVQRCESWLWIGKIDVDRRSIGERLIEKT